MARAFYVGEMDAASTCRDLALRARFGALATMARDPAGWPFATLVSVAFDDRGRPLLLLSRLAEHTKNLVASDRASLLVTEPSSGPVLEPSSSSRQEPLASGRMTLVGACARVPDAERDEVLATFLVAHPEAGGYAPLPDFATWRLEVKHVRWIGGFGKMEWVDGEEYARAGK
jgi:putative heme iron utilization protein